MWGRGGGLQSSPAPISSSLVANQPRGVWLRLFVPFFLGCHQPRPHGGILLVCVRPQHLPAGCPGSPTLQERANNQAKGHQNPSPWSCKGWDEVRGWGAQISPLVGHCDPCAPRQGWAEGSGNHSLPHRGGLPPLGLEKKEDGGSFQFNQCCVGTGFNSKPSLVPRVGLG